MPHISEWKAECAQQRDAFLATAIPDGERAKELQRVEMARVRGEDRAIAMLGVAGALVLVLCAVVPFIMVAVSYEVAMRHFFGLVTLWLNDVTGYLLLALTFLGGAFVGVLVAPSVVGDRTGPLALLLAVLAGLYRRKQS